MTLRFLTVLLLPPLAASAALLGGIVPTALNGGRVAPLDWLVPGLLALALIMLVSRQNRWPRRILKLLPVVLPPLLVCWLAAVRPPWAGMTVFAVLIVLAGLAMAWALGKSRPVMAAVLLLSIALGATVQLIASLDGASTIKNPGPGVGVMSALPLFRDGAGDEDLLDVGARSPLLRVAVSGAVPVDMLDGDSLKAFDRLMLVQPRLLFPQELVALDSWVREGGHVVILADPFLHWRDGRPLGDPRRAPLTSLLDPLLAHWRLVLEPARVNPELPVERRVLSGGALLQLAGASHFTPQEGASCAIAEKGLIARCRIGKGSAILVADADWVNDDLWTQAPATPQDERRWTSDAVPLLAHLLSGGRGSIRPRWPWMASQDASIPALRWALGLIVLLGVAAGLKPSLPLSSANSAVAAAQGVRGDLEGRPPDTG